MHSWERTGSLTLSLLSLTLVAAIIPSVAASNDVSFRSLSRIGSYQGLFWSNLSIVYPILGLPALIGPGQELEIRVVLHDAIEGAWSVAISSPGEEIELQVHNSSRGNGSWILGVSVPSGIPEGSMSVLGTIRRPGLLLLSRLSTRNRGGASTLHFGALDNVHVSPNGDCSRYRICRLFLPIGQEGVPSGSMSSPSKCAKGVGGMLCSDIKRKEGIDDTTEAGELE